MNILLNIHKTTFEDHIMHSNVHKIPPNIIK